MQELFGIQFGINIALAFVLYAISNALKLPKRYLPILAIVIGILLSWIQGEQSGYQVVFRGIQYAFYGVGAVETIRYTFTKHGH